MPSAIQNILTLIIFISFISIFFWLLWMYILKSFYYDIFKKREIEQIKQEIYNHGAWLSMNPEEKVNFYLNNVNIKKKNSLLIKKAEQLYLKEQGGMKHGRLLQAKKDATATRTKAGDTGRDNGSRNIMEDVRRKNISARVTESFGKD